ncbi:hypothetical protein O181_070353 [Austropuccinia psidii MF-1]|uniref:N-alpha-acetyltransferase 60 n=1 Tax=Austropuccinia psidii MF-1 TaxID=1389203 RepID=A0A9Q3F3S4_9BASI|nr:hypothetical protein [Austropuccinia psidii MF-1]
MSPAWLTLVPVTDQPLSTGSSPSHSLNPPASAPPSMSCVTPASISSAPFKKSTSSNHPYNHDHHPSPKSFLKQFILDCPSRRKNSHHHSNLSLSSSSLSSHSNNLIPLLENELPQKDSVSCTSKLSTQHMFEIRKVKVCDIEKIKELHCATLPVTYPSSFFYNLLGTNPQEIGLVATLPTTTLNSYFDMRHITTHQPPTHHHPLIHPSYPHHHASHHVTSPLSGQKPISLDVVGCITARFSVGKPPERPSVRILTLCVHSDYRRCGVGKLLLQNLIKEIKSDIQSLSRDQSLIKVDLHVQATNKVACKFYEQQGFQPACLKKGYYLNNGLKPLGSDLKELEEKAQVIKSLRNQLAGSSTEIDQSVREVQAEKSNCDSNCQVQSDIDAWLLEILM